MRKWTFLLWVIVIAITYPMALSCTYMKPKEDKDSVGELGMSNFVFVGTIEKRGQVTVLTVTPSEHTAVVRVGQVLKSPNFFKKYSGKTVTVLLKDLSGAQEGKEMLFMANGWIAGKGLALREEGRLEKYEIDDVRKMIMAAENRKFTDRVSRAYREADVALLGRVNAITDMAAQSKHITLSEHDPKWQEATVVVNELFKGKPGIKTVKVLFPGSMDVAWYQVPKYKVGQSGIWMLKMDKDLKAYAVRNRLNFFKDDQVDQVKAIIKGLQ